MHFTLALVAIFATQIGARGVAKLTSSDVGAALSSLVLLDDNGAKKGDVVVAYQNMASRHSFDHDNAPNPLFASISSRIEEGATFKAYKGLQALFTIADVDKSDEYSASRTAAANAYIVTVMQTKVMQSAWKFLSSNGLASSDQSTFQKALFDLWFSSYARDSVVGSSGFESVFVGETKDDDVVGLNFWYRFYLLEQADQANYHGWFTKENEVQLELQFAWNDKRAMVDSFLLGTSPEFDFAAFTVCALANIGECHYARGTNNVVLSVKTRSTGGKTQIDSAGPSKGEQGPSGHKTTKAHHSGGNPKLQSLVDAMWAADEDKPNNYVLDWGNSVKGTADVSPNPLFKSVDESLFSKPQYAALILMYSKNLFVADTCTAEAPMSGFRKQYINNVFEAFTNTSMFKLAFNYLVDEGFATDWDSFRAKLWTLWTGTYSRCKGPLGSSGWEHVFLGEFKGSTVDGQHDWVRYYLLEKAGKINYHGYQHHDEQLTGTFQYTWETALKKIGGFNIGTSPAFDFSIFTVCVLTTSGNNACKFAIEGYEIGVTSYTQHCDAGTCISTVYPSDR